MDEYQAFKPPVASIEDAPDSGTVGEHLVTEERVVTAADVLALHLAQGGGAVATFEPAPRP